MAAVKSIPIQTLRDYQQVDLALSGNQQAYRSLFKRYWKRLFFTVNKLVPDQEEARDITIESFSKAFDNLHRFRKTLPSIPGSTGWPSTTASTICGGSVCPLRP
jgi:hypothetical protein